MRRRWIVIKINREESENDRKEVNKLVGQRGEKRKTKTDETD